MCSLRVLAQPVEQRDRILQMRAYRLYPCAPFVHLIDNPRIFMSTLDFYVRVNK